MVGRVSTSATYRDQAAPVTRRGTRQRRAILQALHELLREQPFAEIAVSAISERAGVGRSAFYFYFDSKYSVLAQLLADVTDALDERTQALAPRSRDESPAAAAKRLVGGAAAAFGGNDPVITACVLARHTDSKIQELLTQQSDRVVDRIVAAVNDEIKAGTAHPISDDVPALVRTLATTTALMLSGETFFLDRDRDLQRGLRVLERLWLSAVWGERGGEQG